VRKGRRKEARRKIKNGEQKTTYTSSPFRNVSMILILLAYFCHRGLERIHRAT
jgi:hypothetical protein